MVAAESNFQIPDQDEVFLVSQRKYNLDPCRPWWERFWFRFVFLPFVRFSYKRMRVGAPAGTDAQGNVFMLEEEGVYWNEQTAKDSCQGPFWQVKPFPLNVGLPNETVQYKGHVYPRSIMPDRYRRRTHPVAPAPVHDLKKIKQSFENISKITKTVDV